jgi:arylsulfatase
MHWLRAACITVAWGFLLTGLAGLLEAAAFIARHGYHAPPHPLGLTGSLLAALTISGWFGALLALGALVPLAVILHRRESAAASATGLAIGVGLGLFVAVLLGSLVQDRALGLWWREHLGSLWIPKFALAGAVALLLAIPLRRLVRTLLAARTWLALSPLALLLLATLLWPDWRMMARWNQLGDLEAGTPPSDAPSVVLLSIDTLRRDKLSCLDPAAPPTPHLDWLATTGHLYTNAWSVSSWTLPSMASVMTGLPPRAMGLRRYTALPDAVPTLAQAAWQAGWWTAGVVANPYLVPEYGFARGFADFDHTDVVEPVTPATASVLAREITRYVIGATEPSDGQALVTAAIRWLDRRPPERPFLLWLHFMDPHIPYRWHAGAPGAPAALPQDELIEADRFADMDGLRRQLPDVAPDIRALIEQLYDGEVRYADACVGRLVDALDQRELLDDTWIVVLSDHGEEFFEHGGYEHGHSLLPEVTGIPLIVRPPGGLAEGTRDDRRVGLLDVAPSLARRLDWPLPDDGPGRPCLLPDDSGARAQPAGLTVLENMLYGPPQQATLRWPDLRIVELESGQQAWYALDEDPGALTMRPAPADADTVRARQRELLADWDARARALGAVDRDDDPLSESARRRLRSLGY